jgi:spore coat polysaccharide biosynthesis protein SpsF
MTTKILAILQARMSSSRLPGKVLKPILGEPMLARQIERLRRATTIDRLMVATSNDRSDDPIAALCAGLGIDCFRGSLDDVLDRFCQAAEQHQPEQVVRLTGDCPLADPAVIDAVVRFHLAGGYDYSSNTLHPTFPDGLDVEILRYAVLAEAGREATSAFQREHVTPFIHQQPKRYRLGDVRRSPDLSALRWTVDTAEDFELVSRIYAALYPTKPNFALDDIIALFKSSPDLAKINAAYRRNEGAVEPPAPKPRRS